MARSAILAILRFLRNLASLICSPTICIFCSKLGTYSTFCHSSTYHIIYKYSSFTLFYDVLQE